MKKILIIDDEHLILGGLGTALKTSAVDGCKDIAKPFELHQVKQLAQNILAEESITL